MKHFIRNQEGRVDEFVERCIRQYPDLVSYVSRRALQMLVARLDTIDIRLSGDIE